MRRTLCAILLTTLAASSSQAGYVGSINLSSGSYPNGSLGVNGSNELVATNLLVPSVTSANGTTTALTGAYFDFSTGTQISSSGGVTTYSASSANFFVLPGFVGEGLTPDASSLTAGQATVTATGNFANVSSNNVATLGGTQFQIYEFVMTFTGGFLNQAIANDFGAPYAALPNRLYSGTIDFTFINDSAIAGNQILSGSIAFSVPEPSSFALVLIGGLGVLGYGRRRSANHKAA
jgi:hypothetical protein